MEALSVVEFNGIRNDLGKKFSGNEYFNICTNFSFDDIIGANKTKLPSIEFNSNTDESIDGLFQFNFIDSNSVSQKQNVVIFGGTVYRNFFASLITLHSPFTAGERCDFTVLNDRLFIANGTDIPLVYDGSVVWQMGAPNALSLLTAGVLNGSYTYEMTFKIGGVESRTGTKSNTTTNNLSQNLVGVPIGPADVTERKVYRTAGDDDVLKLLVTISNNTTFELQDNIPDSSLGSEIIPINDPMVRPEFITVVSDKLVGCTVKDRPQRLFFTDTNKEFFTRVRNTLDVTTFGNDNSPIRGMEPDYNQLIVGSEKFLYLVDLSGDKGIVRQTNDNIGIKDGHTMINIPSNESFDGGIIFVSTLNDIRVFNGNISAQTSTALDNLKSYNIGQVIRGTLKDDLESSIFSTAIFFQYKYIVAVDDNIYIFDIRGQKWSILNIRTETFSSTPHSFGVFNDSLFIGQKDQGIVEKAFSEFIYRGEEYKAILGSNQMIASTDLKYFTQFHTYYTTASNCTIRISIIIEGDINNSITEIVNIREGSFSSNDFSNLDFEALTDDEEYNVIHLNRYGRWIQFEIEVLTGVLNFRGFKMLYYPVSDKE